MKLIVGLGNPGRKYEKTRHNSGFLVMDELARLCHADISQNKWNALITQVRIGSEQVILMKPQTFMNESGIAVRQAFDFYKIALEDMLVIHDDMDLKVGSLRIRKKGSSGGQKGMKSIQQHLNSQDISRIRVGVGHSNPGVHEEVPDWVLSPVFPEERETFQQVIEQAAKACYEWVNEPMDLVMNRFNKKG
ncbi:aminoacyl-tRNA hydrolase [Bulleidia sp. zg-1006]|uniref:aminoacyl-tRNA hydrolase n=1 Tax=Bulleidia sp. zg-1006 TaxID=2806552 RepID=UPI00193AD9FC|nr:aminoacyl-tRNA hydrolase [Bulleidia sp. zg-1006]QRG86736.1 aminoacyl-tRNA hydrolase [Bulleidia sp. zg-1006]